MRRLIIASHSILAEGFKETLEFLTGMHNQISSLCAYVEEIDDIDEQIKELVDTTDEIIVLTDMAGGSVNQKFFTYISDRAGMNLPLAMSIALQLGNDNLDIGAIIAEAQQQIIYMNNQKSEERIEDE